MNDRTLPDFDWQELDDLAETESVNPNRAARRRSVFKNPSDPRHRPAVTVHRQKVRLAKAILARTQPPLMLVPRGC